MGIIENDGHFKFYAPWPVFGKRFSAQLGEIRQNTEELFPLVNYSGIYDKDTTNLKDSRLRGWEFGDKVFHNRYRVISDSDDVFKLQVNTGTELSPIWVSILSLDQSLQIENFYLPSFINVEQTGGLSFRTDKIVFNGNDFYLSPTATPTTPQVNLIQKFLQSIQVDDNNLFFDTNRISFNPTEFYLRGGSQGQPVVHLVQPEVSDGVIFDNAVPYFIRKRAFSTPSYVWEFSHNLNLRPITVEAYDSDFSRIEVHEVDISDPNKTYFYFLAPTAGNAVVGAYPPDSAKIFTFSSDLEWEAQHDLNAIVAATVFDNNYRRIQPHELDVSNLNTTYFYFLAPTAGIAVINKFKGSRTFSFPSSVEWQVEHNFNTVPVNAHVYNGALRRVYPQTLVVNDPNIAYFYFLDPTSGTALIEAGVEICDDCNTSSGSGQVTFTDGTTTIADDRLHFNPDSFYLTPDSSGNPVVNFRGTSGGGVTDHGALTGLGDDDHTQYLLVDGTRSFTGTVGGVTPVSGSDLATKGYVDSAVTPGFYGIVVKDSNETQVFKNDTIIFNSDSFYLTGSSTGKPIVNFRGTSGGGVTDHGALTGLGDDDHTQYLLVDGTRSATGNFTFEQDVNVQKDLEVKGSFYIDGKVEVLGSTVFNSTVSVGPPGFEQDTIRIANNNYGAILKVNDFGGTRDGALVLHRHSTSFEPALVFARSNSNDSTHALVAADQILGRVLFVGHTQSARGYDRAAEITAEVDGTPSASTDMPGRLVFRTTPDGSATPVEALRISQDGNADFSYNIAVSGNARADHFIGGGFYFADGSGKAIPGVIVTETDGSTSLTADSIIFNSDSFYLTGSSSGIPIVNLSGTSFTDLGDTPASYSGQAGKYVKVNAGATALEFDTPSVSAPLTLESDTAPQLIVQADTSGTQTAIDLRSSGLHLVASRWIYDSATGFVNWLGALAISRIFGFNVNAPADSLVIDSAGKVGIGTATPAAKLVVVGSEIRLAPTASNQSAIVSTKPTGTGTPGFRITNAGGTQAWRIDQNGGNLRAVDETAGTAPFVVEAAAASNTLVVDAASAVGIGVATPDAAARLQVDSTTKGFLPPRMTDAQMLAISSPPEGLSVWNTDTKCLWTFDGTFWLPNQTAGSRLVHDAVEDFETASTTSNSVGRLGWNISNGASGPVPSTQHHPGVYNRNANANTTLARTQLCGGAATNQLVHSDQLRYWCFVAYVTNLSTGTLSQTKWSCGFYNDQAALPNAGTNAIEFVCDGYGASHTNWYARIDNGSSTSLQDTGVAMTLDSWVRFEVFKTSTSIKFYIDGTLVHTETTVLPSALMYPGFKTIRDVTATPAWRADFWRHVSIHTR